MIYKKKFFYVLKFRIKKLNKKRISEKKNNNYFLWNVCFIYFNKM